jgi:unsaturated rhamnogalacturonyl hydrolase
MMKTYALCGNEAYFSYIKAWVDSIVDPYGNISEFNPGQLDDLQPGVLLFPLYQRTGDARYKAAMDTVAYYIEHFPRCQDGGFWHKAWYRGQMWLDGLYMAGPYAAQYGAAFGQPAFFDLDAQQARIMREKTRDARTGLWYHAWDENRQQPWADKQTGRSPEFWGRSIGWVPVALLEELDAIPSSHSAHTEITRIAIDLLTAVIPHQDDKTGLWYQVVDKGGQAGNWLETSCTCLFVAAICKAVRLGLLDSSALAAARKGFVGVLRGLEYNDQGVLLSKVCIGTGVGDYKHYIERPTSVNDLHGAGAFLLMCTEAEQAL